MSAVETAARKLYDDVVAMRAKIHACNRPILREGLRLELRSDCDTALAMYRRTIALPRLREDVEG